MEQRVTTYSQDSISSNRHRHPEHSKRRTWTACRCRNLFPADVNPTSPSPRSSRATNAIRAGGARDPGADGWSNSSFERPGALLQISLSSTRSANSRSMIRPLPHPQQPRRSQESRCPTPAGGKYARSWSISTRQSCSQLGLTPLRRDAVNAPEPCVLVFGPAAGRRKIRQEANMSSSAPRRTGHDRRYSTNIHQGRERPATAVRQGCRPGP